MAKEKEHVYDAFKQRCVSHRDLYNMFSEDGPTRANMLCLIDCLQHGFHKKDTRRAPARVAPGAGAATHDNVVSEVMNRLGPALQEQISAAINTAMGGLANAAHVPDGGGPAPDSPESAPGSKGIGFAQDMTPEPGLFQDPERAEPPPVPAGYGNPNYVGKSEVHGAADEVTAEALEGLPLAENTTDLKAEPQPVPLTVDELAALRAKIAE